VIVVVVMVVVDSWLVGGIRQHQATESKMKMGWIWMDEDGWDGMGWDGMGWW